MPYTPVEFAKVGEVNRVAYSPTEAVELQYDGWAPVEGYIPPSYEISQYLAEAIREIIGEVLQEGAQIELEEDDDANTLTISSTAITEAQVVALINAVLAGAPGALDTLNELAAALGDDPNFAATITALVGTAQTTANNAASAAGSAQSTADALVVIETARNAAINLGNKTGALNLTAYSLNEQTFRCVATGNLTLAPAGMPSVPAGKSGSFTLRVAQDATGNRVLTLDAAILSPYGNDPALTTTASAVDLIHFFYDGATWSALLGAPALA